MIYDDILMYMRKVMHYSPMFIRKSLTNRRIENFTKYIMTKEDFRICLDCPNRKKEILKNYIQKYPEIVKKMDKSISRIFLNNPKYNQIDEKTRNSIIEDMYFCRFGYGFQIDEYVFYDLGGKNKEHIDRKKIVSDAERGAFRYSANDFTQTIFADKSTAYEFLSKYYKRDAVVIRGKQDYDKYKNFVSGKNQIVQKLVSSSRGVGVELINFSQRKTSKDEYFYEIIEKGKVLLEEVIIQSGEMHRFNPDSVNTVRLFTFYTRNGIYPQFGFFRTGRLGKFIDNAATGGVFASINAELGVVCSDGCDEMGNRYQFHPDSGLKFNGFELPDWKNAVEMCKEAAILVPDLKYLAWDLAYSKEKGWMIVEVNTSGQFVNQGSSLIGIKPELQNIVDNMDLLVPFSFIER